MLRTSVPMYVGTLSDRSSQAYVEDWLALGTGALLLLVGASRRSAVGALVAVPPSALEAHNPNLVGGDIGGGANTLSQVVCRPVPRWNPYATPSPRLFICSSSTPPGGGIHGMCGYWAARTVLTRAFGKPMPLELDL